MPVIKEDDWVVYHRNRWAALDKLATKAGFDSAALEATEACLMTFFNEIVEECAKVAERQANVYTGEHKEFNGCKDSALAIRAFGKNFGNE